MNKHGAGSLRIVADENMPQVEAMFSALGEVRLVPGRGMTADDLAEADILLVRSVTRVDERLLAGSPVRFVGSATIGVDHVDLDYLRRAGIGFANAPGSNARSVAEYVLSALLALEGRIGALAELSVGVLGCGQVGSRVCALLEAAGARVSAYDPLLPAGRYSFLRPFDHVLAADVVCVHTPLTRTGAFPTHHLLDHAVLAGLDAHQLLLNAGRGAVVDNQALLSRLASPNAPAVVLDVWEGEPAINLALLDAVDIGTPHIAGYSLDGKLAGTRMVFEAACRYLGIGPLQVEGTFEPVVLDVREYSGIDEVVKRAVLASYDILADNARMREALGREGGGTAFDRLRREYPVRREFAAHRLTGLEGCSLRQRQQLSALGFALG